MSIEKYKPSSEEVTKAEVVIENPTKNKIPKTNLNFNFQPKNIITEIITH